MGWDIHDKPFTHLARCRTQGLFTKYISYLCETCQIIRGIEEVGFTTEYGKQYDSTGPHIYSSRLLNTLEQYLVGEK